MLLLHWFISKPFKNQYKKILLLFRIALMQHANAQLSPDNLVVLRTESVTNYTALVKVNIIELITTGHTNRKYTPYWQQQFSPQPIY